MLAAVRKIRVQIIALCVVCAVSSCSAPLLPTPRLPSEPRTKLTDAAVLDSLRADWEQLQLAHLSEEERAQIIERYNKGLLLLLRRVRYDVIRRRQPLPDGFRTELGDVELRRSLAAVYDDIVPAVDVVTRSLEEHYVVPGIGVPLVGVIPARKIRPGDRVATLQARGTVSTLTALIEFPRGGGEPVLRLIPRHSHEQARVGRLSYTLAGDFSAPIEVYWNLTQVKKGRFLGLLSPQKLRDTTGLTCMERYDPKRIPVVLTHGLASSASTFGNLVNRLLSDPEIRHRYQFWYFNYPTGVAWTLSAAEYRKSLSRARTLFDPTGKNENWERMVVVGHSMGGLITHYSQCVEPWRLLENAPLVQSRFAAYLNPKYVETPLPNASLESMREVYFFRPVKASRVVYMATPHRGAPMAQSGLALFFSRLVTLPQNLVQEVFNLATLQEDNLLTSPRRLTHWFTSVGQLSPASYSIRGLAPLAVQNVPTHSIIGDRGRHNTPHSSDGIVPYWSSHIPWGTESIVPADHSVQDFPETAELLRAILKDNLKTLNNPQSKRPLGPFRVSNNLPVTTESL